MIKLPSRPIDHAAIISDDGKYRYWLKRGISMFGEFPVVFIMLNPSTADDIKDDPTIRRCCGYAHQWHATEMIVVNLFALRATDPSELWKDGVSDPVGPLNDEAIKYALEYSRLNSGYVIAAWGNHGAYMDRGDTIIGWGWPLSYLKMNKSGQPSHPLYLPMNLTPARLARGK